MGLGIETVGHYNVRKLGENKYSVAVNNGNMGAYVTDEAGVKALKEKYNKSEDTVEIGGKKKEKNVGKAIASGFLPGLGQILDGRVKDGAKDLGTILGLGIVGKLTAMAGGVSFVKATEAAAKGISKTPYGYYAACAAGLVIGAATVAKWVHSVVDAYNGGKK